MKIIIFLFISLLGSLTTNSFAQSTFEALPINSISSLKKLPTLEKKLISKNALPACKQAVKALVLVKIRYYGFDGQEHIGALVVHRSLGKEVIEIFQTLFEHRFPIQAMYPIPSNLKNDPDILSNISASYCCREVTDQPGILSQHSYGRAIDINPMLNPYVKGCLIVPKSSQKYIDRIKPEKGKIIPNSFITQIFSKYGWDWGGNWFDAKDYHHFEKRANGERRDPYGYKTSYFKYDVFNNCVK